MHLLPTLILSIAMAVAAQGVTVPLERVGAYTLLHNPQLAVARARIDEARGRVVGAGRLSNPELEVEYLSNVRVPEGSLSIALMQRFPLTNRLRLEKKISQAQLAAAEAEVRDVERKIVADARTEAVKLVALEAQRQLRMQQLQNSRDQATFIKKRYESGEAGAVDVAQLDLEVRQLEIELLQIASTRAALAGSLRSLLGVPANQPLEITGALPPAPPPAGSTRAGTRPDVEVARHNADAARHSLSLAKARAWQDIGVGLLGSGQRMEDAPEGLQNDFFLGIRFSLPLPIWDRNQGPILEAQAAANRAEKETAAIAFSAEAEVEAARREMAALASVIAEMNAVLLPKAADVEAQFRSAHSAGQTPLTEVLRARARRLELEQRRVDALRDYHLARVRFEAARGLGTTNTGNRK